MVRTNPIPQELVDRPFIEQVRALPARVALEAFLATAAGFTDDPPARDAFAAVLRRLTAEIFSGDLPRDVRKFSPGLQMDYIGRAVHQLVRENYLQLVVFPDFEAAVEALSQAVQRRAADTGSEFSICDESRAPDPVVGQFQVNDKELNAPVTVAMLDARDATNKRSFETMLSDNNVTLTASITEIVKQQMTEVVKQQMAELAAARERPQQAAAQALAPPATTLALTGGAQPPRQEGQPGAVVLAPAAAPVPPQQPPPLVRGTAPPTHPPPPLERPGGGVPLSAEAPTFAPGGFQRGQQAAAPAPGPAPASPARLQQQVVDPPASPGLELAQKVYADINNKWCEVNVLSHQGGMIRVQWTGGESQRLCSMALPRSHVRTLEEHNNLRGQFLIRQFPVLMRFFGAAGEVEQHQYIRMLASGVKSVAGEAYSIDVKAAAVERAIASIGMNEEMVSAMFESGPQEPQRAVLGHVTAKLAEAIRASQQSGDSLVKIADASQKVASLGTQVWESTTTGSGAAYSQHVLASTNEPGARTARVLVDMGAEVQGAEDLLRVGRSRGDFPGKVPQMGHGPLFPSMRTDTQQHAETASMQVSSSVVVSQIMPCAYSASKSPSREDSLLGSIVNGLFADWHLASMVFQWAKQDQTFCIGRLDGIGVAAKDKRAVMGLQDHAWVITTFLEEVLDKWWSQISPWDRGGMRNLAVQFNTLIREGLSVDEINAFFISHFDYAQRRFTGWLQGSVTRPPLMGDFDPQLVALYKVKIRNAQMSMRIRMELGKVPGTPVKPRFSQEDEVRGTSIDPFGDFVWVGLEAHSTYPLRQIIILID